MHTICHFLACVFLHTLFSICSWTIYHQWNIFNWLACFYILYTPSVFKHCSLLNSTVHNPVLWTRNNVVSWENTFQAARNNRTKAKSTCLCFTPFVTCTVFDRDVFDVFVAQTFGPLSSEILVNEGYGSFFLPHSHFCWVNILRSWNDFCQIILFSEYGMSMNNSPVRSAVWSVYVCEKHNTSTFPPLIMSLFCGK